MYIEYKSISKKPDSTTFVPPELFEAQQQGIASIPKKLRNRWDDWVAELLGISKDLLWECYSSEQIDSIGICIFNFEKGRNFFIGDETGIGKGRILSGISRWAWSKGMKVLFFTEREHLISEFWKDLHHTYNIDSIKEPVSFHGKSKVFNPEGEVELKGNIKKVKEIESNGFNPETNLVMTNYSQISLKQHKTNKLDQLKKYCKNSIIILDEAHNATGDSNTKAMLLELIKHSSHCVFSSATYLKDESQLELYESSFSIDAHILALLKKTLQNDRDGTLRKIFTYELTKNLQFWRREHQPLEDKWRTLVCEDDTYNNQIIQRYSETLSGLFKIVSAINEDPSLESSIAANAWFSLGATINRLSRNLLLVLKLDTLAESVKKDIKEGKKAVIVLDSTLSSLVQKIISKNKEDEIDDEQEEIEISDKTEKNTPPLNFQSAILYVIEEVLGEVIHNPYIEPDVKKAYDKLKEGTDLFANLSISPIDSLIESFKKDNIPCGEISGRTFSISSDGKISKLVKLPKTKIVAKFNNGEEDVVILTRAGASGISLHASAAFKDQKVRVLYELEITNRPTYRLQFMGRINRKNQVKQPLFYTVVTRLPFEQRILNVEQQKLKKLQAHISGDDTKMDQASIFNFYNDHTEKAAFSFLQNNRQLAYQMGISLKGDKEDFFYVDSLLKRCIVLSVEQQNFLYDYLIYTVESAKKLELRKNAPIEVDIDYIKNFWHQMDDKQKASFIDEFGSFQHLSINQFKYPWVGLMQTKSKYHTPAAYAMNMEMDLKKNLLEHSDIENYIKKVGNLIVKQGLFNKEYLAQSALPRLKKVKLGTNIIISNPEGKVYGYLHNIEIPNIPDPYKYPDLTLLHIKAVNPHLHNSLYYANEDYYITLMELIESDNVEFSNNPIQWNQFDRPIRDFYRTNHFFIGHPVYMQFLKQCYSIGDIEYFKVGGKNNMCILLPPTFKENYIMNMKKPIYEANKIMDNFIGKKIQSLTTVWQGDHLIKPYFRIEQTAGGYMLMIASEIFNNKDIVDFPLKKKLTEFRGIHSGFRMYFVAYKNLRGILHNLEKHDVIWFIEPTTNKDKK